MLFLLKPVKDISVIRRLEFAARFFPRTMPNYWDTIASFSLDSKEDRNNMTSEEARLFIENLEVVDQDAVKSDNELIREAVSMKRMGTDDSLGIILISNRMSCIKCGSRLYIRQDRLSKVIVYNDNLGTILGTHYTKYCRRKECSFQQHYGYSTVGRSDEMS